MTRDISHPRWGNPPWSIDFQPTPAAMPAEADFAVVGAGFSGLSAASWLRRFAPGKSVVVFESDSIGAGASGHTGGMALAETAAGDLPGLGDVLGGFTSILKELAVDCDLALPGVYEIGRSGGLPDSPIHWSDSGELHAVNHVPGGTIDPGKMVSGLARAAQGTGANSISTTGVFSKNFAPVPCAAAWRVQRRERARKFSRILRSLKLNSPRSLCACAFPAASFAHAKSFWPLMECPPN